MLQCDVVPHDLQLGSRAGILRLKAKFSMKPNSKQFSTIWPRPIGCLIVAGLFLQYSPMISGSFAERDLQLKASYASSPPCIPTCSSLHEDHVSRFPHKT